MILAILFAWLGYKKAKQNGRSGLLWGASATIAFISTQLIVSFSAGILLGLYYLSQGVPEDDIERMISSGINMAVISLAAIIFSIGAGMAVLYFANKPITDENNFNVPPPPPTSFGNS